MMRRSRRGSFALEAALAMPVVMLILALLLGLIAAPAAEMELVFALDQTAAEMALLAPLADHLSAVIPIPDPSPDRVTDDRLISDLDAAIPGWSEWIRSGALDLASSALLAPLIHQRMELWLERSARKSGSFRHMITSRRLFIDLEPGRGELWLYLDYQLRLPGVTLPRQMTAHVPLWTGHGLVSQDDPSRDRIWELDNFSRGRRLRTLYGGNLPYDFPVVARWQAGDASAIKSIDLTAPSYRDLTVVRRTIRDQINRLAGFCGHIYERGEHHVVIDAADIERRTLNLIIPENSPSESLTVLGVLGREAAVSGVNLVIRTHGRSQRYIDDGDFGG